MNQELISFLKAALECSLYVDPREPGLTYDELFEVSKRAGYQGGEIGDSIRHANMAFWGVNRILPDDNTATSLQFISREDPEFRNFDAFDFVVAELNEMTKSDGARNAAIQRNVVVERAVAKGIPRRDIEVAITYQLIAKMLDEKDGILRFPHNNGPRGLPSEQLKTGFSGQGRVMHKPLKARAYPLVKDVIERRADGRPKHAEPLDAFADELDKLGYRPFRLWWTQTVAELLRTNPNLAPVSASVLAAALVEGALTFVVNHGRKHGAFQSPDYAKSPRNWKIDDLVTSAASGGPSAVLDQQVKARAETLIRSRTRIHAGRMLSEYPGGPPDIRPDEARDAKGTAEQVVRAILDWLQKNPASS